MPILQLYRPLVMFEILIAEFLFIFRLQKRKYFFGRFILCVIVGCVLSYFLPLYYNPFYTSFTFLLLFAASLPMIKFCCDEPWVTVFFCGIAGYTVQHFSYGVANLAITLVENGQKTLFDMYVESSFDFTEFNMETLFMVLVYLLAIFTSYTFLFLMFGRKIKRGEGLQVKSNNILVLVGVALVVDIFLNAVVIYYFKDGSIGSTVMDIVYEDLCCFFLLYIQFGLLKTGKVENELHITQVLLRENERQYNLSKENVELINLKCHDLRHQINVLGAEQSLSEKAVNEIKSAISIYDAGIHTDNEVLDIILTEKNLKCVYSGISLTCVADGHSLEFMDKADVYSLFGNALDNAIEATQNLNKGERNISLTVHSVGNMVSINLRNNYQGSIKLDEEGFPLTKKDTDYHGYGVKSIRYIADKYHGSCAVRVNDNVFNINVLLVNQIG